jgi:hypothetical protein
VNLNTVLIIDDMIYYSTKVQSDGPDFGWYLVACIYKA